MSFRADELQTLSATEFAEVLQACLVSTVDRWNSSGQLNKPLKRLPWQELDPVSRALYVERCAAFLKDYTVSKKEADHV
jgi:hypothetical protein